MFGSVPLYFVIAILAGIGVVGIFVGFCSCWLCKQCYLCYERKNETRQRRRRKRKRRQQQQQQYYEYDDDDEYDDFDDDIYYSKQNTSNPRQHRPRPDSHAVPNHPTKDAGVFPSRNNDRHHIEDERGPTRSKTRQAGDDRTTPVAGGAKRSRYHSPQNIDNDEDEKKGCALFCSYCCCCDSLDDEYYYDSDDEESDYDEKPKGRDTSTETGHAVAAVSQHTSSSEKNTSNDTNREATTGRSTPNQQGPTNAKGTESKKIKAKKKNEKKDEQPKDKEMKEKKKAESKNKGNSCCAGCIMSIDSDDDEDSDYEEKESDYNEKPKGRDTSTERGHAVAAVSQHTSSSDKNLSNDTNRETTTGTSKPNRQGPTNAKGTESKEMKAKKKNEKRNEQPKDKKMKEKEKAERKNKGNSCCAGCILSMDSDDDEDYEEEADYDDDDEERSPNDIDTTHGIVPTAGGKQTRGKSVLGRSRTSQDAIAKTHKNNNEKLIMRPPILVAAALESKSEQTDNARNDENMDFSTSNSLASNENLVNTNVQAGAIFGTQTNQNQGLQTNGNTTENNPLTKTKAVESYMDAKYGATKPKVAFAEDADRSKNDENKSNVSNTYDGSSNITKPKTPEPVLLTQKTAEKRNAAVSALFASSQTAVETNKTPGANGITINENRQSNANDWRSDDANSDVPSEPKKTREERKADRKAKKKEKNTAVMALLSGSLFPKTSSSSKPNEVTNNGGQSVNQQNSNQPQTSGTAGAAVATVPMSSYKDSTSNNSTTSKPELLNSNQNDSLHSTLPNRGPVSINNGYNPANIGGNQVNKNSSNSAENNGMQTTVPSMINTQHTDRKPQHNSDSNQNYSGYNQPNSNDSSYRSVGDNAKTVTAASAVAVDQTKNGSPKGSSSSIPHQATNNGGQSVNQQSSKRNQHPTSGTAGDSSYRSVGDNAMTAIAASAVAVDQTRTGSFFPKGSSSSIPHQATNNGGQSVNQQSSNRNQHPTSGTAGDSSYRSVGDNAITAIAASAAVNQPKRGMSTGQSSSPTAAIQTKPSTIPGDAKPPQGVGIRAGGRKNWRAAAALVIAKEYTMPNLKADWDVTGGNSNKGAGQDKKEPTSKFAASVSAMMAKQHFKKARQTRKNEPAWDLLEGKPKDMQTEDEIFPDTRMRKSKSLNTLFENETDIFSVDLPTKRRKKRPEDLDWDSISSMASEREANRQPRFSQPSILMDDSNPITNPRFQGGPSRRTSLTNMRH